MIPRRLQQPSGSSLCGQSCIAMAAGVSLPEAIAAVGHQKTRGTKTAEVVSALRRLGVPCADRLRRVSRSRPVLPARAIVAIYHSSGTRAHWMLTWDGTMHDPEHLWPDYYRDWIITSYLEIFA